MNKAGKRRNTSGKTSLMVVFAALSSACCRRRVRRESEWTRRDCARLVPSFSVWISIATRDLTSSTPVLSESARNASCRGFPATISRLTMSNSSLNAGLESWNSSVIFTKAAFSPEARLDADDQQVQPVREGVRDLLLALADLPSKHEIREEEPGDSCHKDHQEDRPARNPRELPVDHGKDHQNDRQRPANDKVDLVRCSAPDPRLVQEETSACKLLPRKHFHKFDFRGRFCGKPLPELPEPLSRGCHNPTAGSCPPPPPRSP